MKNKSSLAAVMVVLAALLLTEGASADMKLAILKVKGMVCPS